MGYFRAGFDVVGVDIEPQPRYPFTFIQADALTFPLSGFDVVHASPPCQAYSSMRTIARRSMKVLREYPDLIGPTRARLRAAGVPYVIENVIGAPLINAVLLCGTSFGLPLRRHRLFESSVPLLVPPCAHELFPKVIRNPHSQRRGRPVRFVAVYGGTRYAGDNAARRAAMEIGWMRAAELTQAIPPAYTELIGRQLLSAIAYAA